MDKEKIKKLFQGTKEDMIIACRYLVENYNILEFISDWCRELPLHSEWISNSEDKFPRPLACFGSPKLEEYITEVSEGQFYYRKYDEIIYCCPGSRITYCIKEYVSGIEVINHF